MKLATAVALAVGLALGLAGRSTLGPPSPRARLAREVRVLWRATGQLEVMAQPGTHELDFPCGNARDRIERMTVVVTPASEATTKETYRDCTPQEALRLAQANSGERVHFDDALAEVRLAGEGGPEPVPGTDGQAVAVNAYFLTKQGLWCLVPADRPELMRFLRTVVAGDELAVKGRAVLAAAGPCVLVEGLQFKGTPSKPDESPWTVSVLWNGAEVTHVSEPGEYRLTLPCLHRPGAVEAAEVRLREFRVVDLSVGGHPVTAELADTPAARSWGLQGRAGLAPDEGMLFFFEAALRPTFVMKTVSFPIAVAFINADGVIVDVARLDPGDQVGVTSPAPVNYALEVRQDWFESHGVPLGAKAVIP
jgi:hypothetical protein